MGDSSLEHRIFVVTGDTQGLGEATARILAELMTGSLVHFDQNVPGARD